LVVATKPIFVATEQKDGLEMERTQDGTESPKQIKMEWGIFRRGDATDQTPAENMLYSTREAAEKTRKKSYLHPTNWEVRGREIGPWDVKARG
jgi:hypothetical protein